MATLLQALLANESGGKNVANVDQGTSSGQAQGYFQITTGTWNDFGGQKYAPNPMAASYAQQAEIASKIPLKRWDESTVAKMRATGIPIDTNRTLGENLSGAGEGFGESPAGAPALRHVGGAGSAPANFTPAVAPVMTDAVAGDNPYTELADSVQAKSDLSGILSAATGGQGAAEGGIQGDISPDLPTLSYDTAVPTGGLPMAAGAPVGATPEMDLASLFKVADIGGPPVVTGKSPPRQRFFGG